MASFESVNHSQVLESFPRKTHRGAPWFGVAGLLVLAIVLLAVVALLEAPSTKPGCGLRCAPPPPPSSRGSGKALSPISGSTARFQVPQPVHFDRSYHSSTYGFTLYWDSEVWPDASSTTSGHVEWGGGNGLVIEVGGDPPRGRSAEQMVRDIAQGTFPDFHLVYTIPGAEVGYVPGAGAVYAGTVTSADGQSIPARCVLEVAIKRDVGVVVYEAGNVDSTANPGDPAQMPYDEDVDMLANTVTWPGGPSQ